MSTLASNDSVKNWFGRHATWLHRVAILGIFVSALAIMWAMPMKEFADQLRGWSQQQNGSGGFLFVGSYVLLTIFSLPVWPMPLVAGAAFGKLWGTILASLSCVLGASATFFIARGLRRWGLREYLEASPRMRALEKTVSVGSWKVVAAVRLSHLLPFGLQNYAFGATKIRFRTFCLTTWLVTLPGIFLQVWLGDLGYETVDTWQSQEASSWTNWLMQAGGVLILMGALAYLGYLGKSVYWSEADQQLNRQLEKEQRQEGAVWPIATLVLLVVMLVLGSLAIWSVIEHETIRQWVAEVL